MRLSLDLLSLVKGVERCPLFPRPKNGKEKKLALSRGERDSLPLLLFSFLVLTKMLASTGRRLAAGLFSTGSSNGSSSLLNGALVAAADSILFSSSLSSMSSIMKPPSRSLSTDTDIRKVLADKIPKQQVRRACSGLKERERERKSQRGLKRALSSGASAGERKERQTSGALFVVVAVIVALPDSIFDPSFRKELVL